MAEPQFTEPFLQCCTLKVLAKFCQHEKHKGCAGTYTLACLSDESLGSIPRCGLGDQREGTHLSLWIQMAALPFERSLPFTFLPDAEEREPKNLMDRL